MDALNYDVLWMAEHHFQREGYEVIPNLIQTRAVARDPDQAAEVRSLRPSRIRYCDIWKSLIKPDLHYWIFLHRCSALACQFAMTLWSF